jgi:uncharacterized membrane protein YeaQ/YmgE (transglycosylase-associated protein family)
MSAMIGESVPSSAGFLRRERVHKGRRRATGENKTMSLIYFLIVGLIAGVIASYVMGRQQDLLVNLLIGVVGAVVGGFLAGLIGIGAYGLLGEIVIATLGAILCIYVWMRMR